MDNKAMRILEAIRRKKRPYTAADIARATHLSKHTVWARLAAMTANGDVKEVWIGERDEPYYQLGQSR